MTTKQCPDCAESVLAEARKCRFCGYRFAPPPAAAGADSGPRSLLDIVRPARRPDPPPVEVLQSWGIELHDERLLSVALGAADGNDGYVVLTDRRILFVAEATRTVLWWHPLGNVLTVTTGGRLARRRVRVQGLAIDVTIRAVTKDLAEQVERARRLAAAGTGVP